jgi:hypothetical protein
MGKPFEKLIIECKNKTNLLPKKIVGKNEINNYNKMRMLKTIYLPTVNWTTLKKHESKITGTEMRYLGKCMEKKTRRDSIGNSQIRRTLNQGPVTKMVYKRELRYIST